MVPVDAVLGLHLAAAEVEDVQDLPPDHRVVAGPVFVDIYIYICIHMCIYIYIIIYSTIIMNRIMNRCIYIYIYREREREIDRYTYIYICMYMRPGHRVALQLQEAIVRGVELRFNIIQCGMIKYNMIYHIT